MTTEPVHFAPYRATNAACDETVPPSVVWDVILADHASRRFTVRREKVTCPECRWRIGVEDRPETEPLPLECREEHGYECCGCITHPAGKPWGWNARAWEEHWAVCPNTPPAASVPDAAPPDGERRLVIRVNSNAGMSRGKYAAQAVHAALTLLGVHPGTPVIVLGGKRSEIEQMPTQIRDAGRTEVEPGTLTAGAEWVREPKGDQGE